MTKDDFDFNRKVLKIDKSYQRLQGKDYITDPKTKKSERIIQMPDILVEEIQEYTSQLYGCSEGNRIFPINKSYLYHEMKRGSKIAGCQENSYS